MPARTHLTRVIGAAAAVFALVPTPAVARTPPRGLVYGGATSQNAPFVLVLRHGGRAVHHAAIVVGARCSDGARLSFFATLSFGGKAPPFIGNGRHFFADDQISRSGAFASTGLGAGGFGDTSGPIIEKITGRFKADGAASGTYSATVTLLDEKGEKVASCDTGAVRWTVRSDKGRVYAGSTSQDMPIVVQLDRHRTKVTGLLMGWGAACSPTGDVLIGERLVDFPISGNAFGDRFSDELDLDGGGKRKFDYALKGRLGAAKATGRLSVRLQDSDPFGGTTCATGPIRWSARTG